MVNAYKDLSTEEKVGQLFFVGIAGTKIDQQDVELLDKISPGGICLFARNIREASQTRELLRSLNDRRNIRPFLSLDQEGGLVDRLRRLIAPMPAANLIRNAEIAGRFGTLVAEIIRILGFNMDFAPVVDVVNDERESISNGLFSRTFGRSADESAELAGAFLENLQNGGVLGCVKHFPGLGFSKVDSHEELPQVDITEDELRRVDLVPYERLLARGTIRSVMVAHAAYPRTGLQERSLGGKLLPSSLSGRVITDLLRNELQFEGLVITDDLEMGAIIKDFGIGDACVKAIAAGGDMLAICADAARINEGYNAVLEAVAAGAITEERLDESLRRIGVAKEFLTDPLPFDPQRLAELSDAIVRLNDEKRSETLL